MSLSRFMPITLSGEPIRRTRAEREEHSEGVIRAKWDNKASTGTWVEHPSRRGTHGRGWSARTDFGHSERRG